MARSVVPRVSSSCGRRGVIELEPLGALLVQGLHLAGGEELEDEHHLRHLVVPADAAVPLLPHPDSVEISQGEAASHGGASHVPAVGVEVVGICRIDDVRPSGLASIVLL